MRSHIHFLDSTCHHDFLYHRSATKRTNPITNPGKLSECEQVLFKERCGKSNCGKQRCSQGDGKNTLLFISLNSNLISWTNISHIRPRWRLLSHCGESWLFPLDSIIFSTLCYPQNIPVLSANSAFSYYRRCWATIGELRRVSCVGGTWKKATTAGEKKKKRKGPRAQREGGNKKKGR